MKKKAEIIKDHLSGKQNTASRKIFSEISEKLKSAGYKPPFKIRKFSSRSVGSIPLCLPSEIDSQERCIIVDYSYSPGIPMSMYGGPDNLGWEEEPAEYDILDVRLDPGELADIPEEERESFKENFRLILNAKSNEIDDFLYSDEVSEAIADDVVTEEDLKSDYGDIKRKEMKEEPERFNNF